MPRLPDRPTARSIDRIVSHMAFIGVGRVIGVVLAVGGLVGGAWWATRSPTPSGPVPGSTTMIGEAPTFTLVPPLPEDVVVHVVGAVMTPGVYRLEPGSRVIDAVEAAGGPRPDAVLEAINLAAAISDGQRIRVPTPDDPPSSAESIGSASDGAPGRGSTVVGVVDINTAGVEELDRLPGVGPALATAIVHHRERHGPFESVDDLVAVSGIGPAKLEVLRPLVRAG